MDIISIFVDDSKINTGLSNYANSLIYQLSKRINVQKTFVKSHVPSFISFFIALIGVNLNSVFKTFPFYLSLPINRLSHLTSQQQTICLNYLKRDVVVTVHDIIPLATNKYNSFFAKLLYLLAMRGLKRAKFIIADSEHTKSDIIKFLNYPADRITVIQLGVDHSYFRPARINEIKRDRFTVLYVGSEMPRKNLITLFRAFVIVKQKIPEAKLVKVGLSQWRGARKKLLNFVKENNLQDSITFKDYVENLAEEYQKATVFVFPSKYEGFGLPPLEVMACGCPVICSNATSLPEVVGDSAVLFEPDDVQALADKIVRLLKSKKLQSFYSAQGIKRASQFTWKKCAKETISVYSSVANFARVR